MIAQLAATVTTVNSQCPSTGSITVNATGGTAPYSYLLRIGQFSIGPQSSNVFNSLPASTYSVVVTDATSASVQLDNVTVASSYVQMNPTARAITETCGGSNTGSIVLSMPAGQGIAPYTYRIVSGPTSQPADTGITATSYTFNNLAPGSYRVSVTDACGQVQARDAVLRVGQTHTNDIVGVANNGITCDSTDYYLQPQIGAYFPHTYYAYPNGDLTQTPYTITFANADAMVTVQGANGLRAFKWTLPTPTPFVGGKYAFKYTDVCNTDVNSPNVRATTVTLGNRRIIASAVNCSNNMNVWVGNGWSLPVTITATPTNGGTPLVQQITDADTRTTTFTNLPGATTYEVTFQDNCASHVMTDGSLLKETFTVSTDKNFSLHKRCGGNIDGLSGIDMTFGNGWQKNTITATFNSGPTTYHSAIFDQDFSVSYPRSYNIDPDGVLRVNNLAPGTYNITLTDGCYSTPYTFTVDQNNGTTYSFSDPLVAGCAGAQTLSGIASSTCNSLVADIYNAATNSTIGNGHPSNFTLNNVPPGNYIIYYYTSMMKNALFISPTVYQNNSTAILIKSIPVTVPVLDSYPSLGSYGIAQCDGTGTGGINVQLYKSSNSANIRTFSIERTAGQGDFYTPQASNIFTLADYGSHAYRLTDECGNTSTGSIDVQPNINPVISISANTCLANADLILSVEPQQNATYVWNKPDGSTVTGSSLTLKTGVDQPGIYKVVASHSVGSCTETKEKTFTVNSCDITTPVAYTQLLKATLKNKSVTLTWATGVESNTKGFAIQRSSNSKDYTQIGFVNAKGANNRYEFTDDRPANGTNYYRLAELSNSGDNEYSNTVAINITHTTKENISLYPNPAHSQITVVANGQVNIYDMSGKLVLTKVVNGKAVIDISRLANGVYILRTQTGSAKFIKQ